VVAEKTRSVVFSPKNLILNPFFLPKTPTNRGDYFQFGSIFIKKSNQTGFFKIPKSVQTDRFQFGLVILEQKPVQIDRVQFGLALFFRFDSVFFDLAWFLVWVWLGFFGFRLIKPNRTIWFF